MEEIDKVLSRIEAAPHMYAVTMEGVRRVKAKRFPYIVYYRVLEGRVEILAVLHGRRSSRAWQDRLD